jgi:hypothetical protein
MSSAKPAAAFDAITRRAVPFTSTDGRAFAQVPAASLDGHHTLAIRSRAFREWFFSQSDVDCETTPSPHAWSAICRRLEAQASADPDRRNIRVAHRVTSRGNGPVPEKILIDLANPEGQYVEITHQGWRVSAGKTVNFETSLSTSSLPTPSNPAAGASDPIDTLRASLNLAGSPEWPRVLSWLLRALQPDGPYPILVLRNSTDAPHQPSGKSFAARVLRAIADPCTAPLSALPSSAAQLLQLAATQWTLAFDHVSSLAPTIADTLCRLSTGVDVPVREPGHHELSHLWVKRPIILTVTSRFSLPPDLEAHAVTVTLPAITPQTTRPEPELLADLEAAMPAILAMLYLAISKNLKAHIAHPEGLVLPSAKPAKKIKQICADDI